MSSREVLKALKSLGWYIDRISGSHHQLRHPIRSGVVTVPHPKKDLKPKTLASIEKQAGVDLRKKD